MTNEAIRHFIITLHYIHPLPLPKLQHLLQTVTSIKELQAINTKHLAGILAVSEQKAVKIKSLLSEYLPIPFEKIYEEKGIRLIMYEDPFYPKELLQLIDPPTLLYTKGNVELLLRDKISIIGSRHATNYSKRALQYIVPPLVESNYVIVSGMAKGADTFAHQATIHFSGQTIAVMGTGFDFIYPRENERLFNELIKNQLVITEFPPYFGPKKWQFPMRNRIISGLSRALVVTEAALRSGTLITTEHALEHGKDVYVVPGPIDAEQCLGTNKLLKEGAIPLLNGYQIVDEMSLFYR